MAPVIRDAELGRLGGAVSVGGMDVGDEVAERVAGIADRRRPEIDALAQAMLAEAGRPAPLCEWRDAGAAICGKLADTTIAGRQLCAAHAKLAPRLATAAA